jgi:hypothetical protein
MEYDLNTIVTCVDRCIEFNLLEVKVSIIFSARWVSRYAGTDVTLPFTSSLKYSKSLHNLLTDLSTI